MSLLVRLLKQGREKCATEGLRGPHDMKQLPLKCVFIRCKYYACVNVNVVITRPLASTHAFNTKQTHKYTHAHAHQHTLAIVHKKDKAIATSLPVRADVVWKLEFRAVIVAAAAVCLQYANNMGSG